MPPAAGKTHELLGVHLQAMRLNEVVNRVEETLAAGKSLDIGVVNVAKMVAMRDDRPLREAVMACDLVLADGMGVVWAGRLLGVPLPERVTGIDLMEALLDRSAERGWRVFLLGASPEVLQIAEARIRTDRPGLVIAGTHHGYFSDDEEEAVVQTIVASQADVIFVAISSPKKEVFLGRWGDSLGVPIRHGVGGAFDVVAGKTSRAPIVVQRAGLEWAWRLVQEPRRLWKRYLVTNTRFSLLVGQALVERLRGQHD